VELATVTVEVEEDTQASVTTLELNYSLRASNECDPTSLTMVAPELGHVEHIWCSAATNAHLSRWGDLPIIEFTRPEGARFHGATIKIRLRWDQETRRRLNGSPVCVLPDMLPQLPSPHGPYTPVGSGEPDAVSDAPRLIVNKPFDRLGGSVVDAAGAVLMLALPVDRQLERAVWHADDSLVLAASCFVRPRQPIAQRSVTGCSRFIAF
jgi:hypothetical protein